MRRPARRRDPSQPDVLIWLSNSQACVAYNRAFFVLLCDNLVERWGAAVADSRFDSLRTLSELPWLDQPQLLDPTRLMAEVHLAWNDLWTTPVCELVLTPLTKRSALHPPVGCQPGDATASRDPVRIGEGSATTVGQLLAGPMSNLVLFAASAIGSSLICAGTHRRLIFGLNAGVGLRVIQGGRSVVDWPDRSRR